MAFVNYFPYTCFFCSKNENKSARREERFSTAAARRSFVVCTIEISRKIEFLFLRSETRRQTRARERTPKQTARERLETILIYLSLLALPYSISLSCSCRDCSVPTTFWFMSLFAWWNKWFLRFEVLSVNADEVPAARCDGGDESKAFKRGAVSWWCNGRGLMDY